MLRLKKYDGYMLIMLIMHILYSSIRLWDLAKPSSPCLSVLREHESDVWAIDWAPMAPSSGVDSLLGGSIGGGKFASGGKDGQIRWWRSAG